MAELHQLESRVDIVETKLEWNSDNISEIKKDLDLLKGNHVKLFEKFGDLTDEMGKLRGELHQEIGNLRSELHHEIGSVRDEIGGLRSELHREIGSVRGEIGGLRGEMHKEFAHVHEKISDLHGSIAAMTRWILLGMLGAVTLISILQPLMNRWLAV